MKLRRWCRSRTAARLGGTAAVSLVLAGSLVLTTAAPASALVGIDDVIVAAGVTAAAPASVLAVVTSPWIVAGAAVVAVAGVGFIGYECLSGGSWCPFNDEFGEPDGVARGYEMITPGEIPNTARTGGTVAVGGWMTLEFPAVASWDMATGRVSASLAVTYNPYGDFTASRALPNAFTSYCQAGPGSTDVQYPSGSLYSYVSQAASPYTQWTAQVQDSYAHLNFDPCSGAKADNPGGDWLPLAVLVAEYDGSIWRTNSAWWPNPYASDAVKDSLGALQTYSVDKVCKDSGGVQQTVTVTALAGDPVPLVACPAGTVPVSETVFTQTIGGPREQISSTGWGAGVPEEYPNCVGQACALWVQVDGVTVAQGNPDAPYWWAISQVTPERVSCQWGGAWGSYAMPLTDCAPLKYAYATTSTVGTTYQPERGWVPVLAPEMQPWPTESPLPEVETMPEPEPTGSPSATPSNSVDPSASPSGSTPVIPESGANPDPDPSDNALECIGATWTWNPISWVYAPVKCALLWAFVPQSGALDNVKDDIETSWNDTPIPTWVDVPLGLIPSGASSGGCAGPAMALGDPFNATLYPLSACEAPMSGIAAVCKTGISAILVFAGVRSSLSLLLSGIGFAWPSHEIGGK